MTALARFLRPYLVPLGGSTALTLAGTALDLARPWPLQLAVDGAISERPLSGPFAPLDGLSPAALAAVAAGIAVVLVALAGLVGYAAEYAAGSTAERVGADLRGAVFARLQRLSLRFHDRNRTGDLVNRLTSDVSRVQDALVAGFETLLPSLLTLVGMVVAVLVIDLQLGLVALAVVPPLALVVTVLRRRLKRAQRRTRALYGALASGATDVLRNVRVVQAFAREDDEEERFREQSAAMMRSAVTAVKIEASYSPASDVVLAVGSGLVLWLGVLQVRQGELTVGTLLVILTYVSSVYRPIRSLARLASTLAKGAVSAERLTEILESEEDVPQARDPVAAPS
jgi:ABC-type multidrug transport system fused ATPase/permease subunit